MKPFYINVFRCCHPEKYTYLIPTGQKPENRRLFGNGFLSLFLSYCALQLHHGIHFLVRENVRVKVSCHFNTGVSKKLLHDP